MRVGITGGIASGKSLITSMLRTRSYPVIDADEIAHKLMEPTGPSYQAIIDYFGREMLDAEGKINRKKLGLYIFNNYDEREALNRISHPLIKAEIEQEANKYPADQLIFLDIPLLYESEFLDLVDRVILVYTRPEIQLKRLMVRDDIDYEFAQAKINSQMPLVDKISLADYVIDNSGSRESTYLQLADILKKLALIN